MIIKLWFFFTECRNLLITFLHCFCQLKLALKVLRSLHILCFFLDDMEVSYFFIYVFNFFIRALLHPVVSFFFEIIFDFLKFNLIPWVYFLFFWTHFFLKSLLSSKKIHFLFRVLSQHVFAWSIHDWDLFRILIVLHFVFLYLLLFSSRTIYFS